MFWVILAIPLLSSFMLIAFVLDEWEEEKQKAKEKEDFERRKKDFIEKYLTKH